MTGREGVILAHVNAIHKGKGDIRHVDREPAQGAVGVSGVLERLGGEAGDGEAADTPHTIAYTSPKEDKKAHGVREPFGRLRVIPIKYIARGRVAVA